MAKLFRLFHGPPARLIVAAAAAGIVAGHLAIGGAASALPGPGATLRDTSAADFAAGTRTGTSVSQTSDGELILAPTAASEFTGPALPTGWIEMPWGPNGSVYVDRDDERQVLVVDGARFATCVTDANDVCLPGETTTTTPFAIFTAPHSLEFSANFSGDRFQHSGFAVTFDTSTVAAPWAIFSTEVGGRMYARSATSAGETKTDLGAGLLGAFHHYRIDWKPASIDFYVDDGIVATHPVTIVGTMRPIAGSDVDAFGTPLLVDWMRMSPYAASGTFDSRVFDANGPAAWQSIQWVASTPAGTSVAISVRTGNTPTPDDGSWSGFIPVAAPGPLNLGSRFIQYRAEMTSSDPDHTPALEDISITTGQPPVAVPDSANVPGNGNFTFPAAGPGSLTDNDTDADLDALAVSAVAPPAHGTTVLNADGSVTYTPAANYFGSDAFIYTVSDGVLTANGTVSIVVSAGPAPVTVPNVVGLTQAAAASAITGAGLTVGTVTRRTSATVAAELVISESPEAGTSFAAGSSVNLVVSSGPAPVRVPDVVGLTQAGATSAITGTQLIVGTVETASSATVAAGLIISEIPAARSSVPAGSAVNLVVSSGRPPVGVPNVIGLTRAAATSAITAAGLTVGTVTLVSSPAVAAGSVMDENPPAGTVVAAGSAVDSVVRAQPHLLDLNGDGSGDVFLYNRTSGARRFEVATSGGFQESSNTWDPGWQIHPANLNADGYTDFFLYDPVRGLWIQALNHGGDGTFTYTLGDWDSSWTVVPADLDGDGLTDMFVYNFTSGVWVKCFTDGSGGFKGYAAAAWDPGWTFSQADLNGDGRDDLFLYNRVNGVWVEAFSQPGFGGFDYPASGQWDPGWQLIPADLNGDTRMDVFLLNAAGVHVSALSRSNGGFDYTGGPQWAEGWSVSPGDLNGDGSADLFLYNRATGAWVEAFSDGAGSFAYTPGQWDAGWAVRLTDFNGDGLGDLLLTNAAGTWIQATNAGNGTFGYAAGNWGTGWALFTKSALPDGE